MRGFLNSSPFPVYEEYEEFSTVRDGMRRSTSVAGYP